MASASQLGFFESRPEPQDYPSTYLGAFPQELSNISDGAGGPMPAILLCIGPLSPRFSRAPLPLRATSHHKSGRSFGRAGRLSLVSHQPDVGLYQCPSLFATWLRPSGWLKESPWASIRALNPKLHPLSRGSNAESESTLRERVQERGYIGAMPGPSHDTKLLNELDSTRFEAHPTTFLNPTTLPTFDFFEATSRPEFSNFCVWESDLGSFASVVFMIKDCE